MDESQLSEKRGRQAGVSGSMTLAGSVTISSRAVSGHACAVVDAGMMDFAHSELRA